MKKSIFAKLPGDFPWRERISCYEIIDSTNTRAKELAAAGAPHGTVLIADAQTGGRGRMGRSFHSPAGTGIYLSVILRPDCPPAKLMHLTCATAVALCAAVERSVGLRPGIKWTNDLVHNGKKLAGILTELSLDPKGETVAYAVVGVGINCCQDAEDFPTELQSIAASLSMVTGSNVDRSLVTAAVIEALYEMDASLLTQKTAIMDRYRSDCITIGKAVSICKGDEIRHALATGVDEEGALLVTFPDGHSEAVSSGEVSVRGMYGYV